MRPRLLLNENFPLPNAKRLRSAGWDVLAIAESHASIDDAAVMRLAHDDGRWLVTFDRDTWLPVKSADASTAVAE